MLSPAELEAFRLGVGAFSGTRAKARQLTADEWVQRKLGEKLHAKQREVAQSVDLHRRTAVPSAFGTGKSHLGSRLACRWIDTHPPGEAIVITTATSWAQVRGILWQQIGFAHSRGKLFGRVNQTEWWIGDRLVGFGRRPPNWSPDAFTGYHYPYVLVIIDEASGVPKDIFDAVEGLVVNEDSRILAIGNPYASDSHFAHICRPDSPWNVVRISAFDTPAFTGEAMPEIAMKSLTSQLWVDENTKEWGKDSALYQTKILGQFPTESDDQLISLVYIEAARAHQDPGRELTNHPVIGVDVARFGEDETVIAARWGWHIEILETFKKKPTTYTAGAVRRWVDELECRDVRVDDDGIGGAVTDMLREDGIQVDALHNGGTPADPSRFVDARSEWWWKLREAFVAGEPDIPDDDKLAGQLVSLHYTLDRRGRIKVESKDDMRKRGVRSPDRGDGILYTVATSRAVAPVVAPVSVPQSSSLRGLYS